MSSVPSHSSCTASLIADAFRSMIVISAIALNAFHPSIFFKEPKTEPDFIVDEHGDFKKNNMAADMAEKDYCRRCRRGTQSPPPRVRPRVGLNRQPSNPPYYKV